MHDNNALIGNLTEERKGEHVRVCLEEDVEKGRSTLLECVDLIHRASSEVAVNEVNTSVEFLGYKLLAPLVIEAMTGGYREALSINKALAEVAEEKRIAIGVGSQRAALEKPELKGTFTIVREVARSVPVIANIGAAQISKEDGWKLGLKAVEMLDADALAVHLNLAQEALQPEGDVGFKGLMKSIEKLVLESPVPIIIKETGCGLSKEDVISLKSVGVEIFDIGGAGGTNWILIEEKRARRRGEELKAVAASTLREWGIPTALSLIEARWAAPCSTIICSGGIRTGLDVAKSIALGGDLAGIALPLLREVMKSGSSGAKTYIDRVVFELKVVMALTGSRNITELKRASLIIKGPLKEAVEQRGIDVELYVKYVRCFKP